MTRDCSHDLVFAAACRSLHCFRMARDITDTRAAARQRAVRLPGAGPLYWPHVLGRPTGLEVGTSRTKGGGIREDRLSLRTTECAIGLPKSGNVFGRV